MAGQGYVYAGAVTSMEGGKPGVFRQAIEGERWEALMDGLPGEAQVHAITVHPDDPNIVFVATTKGAYRSTDRGAQWRRLSLPDDNTDIWSITIHPKDRKTIYAGYGPVGVYRSDDGGERWAKLPQPGLPDRVHMTFPCRVMRLDVNPAQPDEVYACIEANGAMKSRDRGESWEDCTADLLRFAEQEKYKSRIVSQTEIEGMLDGHALACSAAAPGTVFLANRMGLFRSDDQGAHWTDVEVGRYSPMTYGRDLRVSPHDPKVLYAALSPAFRQRRRRDLQERECRQGVEALRPRRQGGQHDDGRGAASARSAAGLCRLKIGAGVRHARRRRQLERDAIAAGHRRLLRGRLRLTKELHHRDSEAMRGRAAESHCLTVSVVNEIYGGLRCASPALRIEWV